MSRLAGRQVDVAGGTIYCVVRGTGPVLLLMGGGPSNADTLEPLASGLAGVFTVVTYDRRGYSRSQVSDQTGPGGIAQHADDARQLIAALGAAKDASAALDAIAASVGVRRDRARGAPGAGPVPADVELFIRRDAPAIGAYTLDLGRLRPLAGRLTVAASEDSRDFYPYQCALRLAQRLGTSLAELPGGHAGMISRPAPFAGLLRPPAVRGTMHGEGREGVTK